MNSMHEFVVLRLAPNPMRGEVLNVGAVVFYPDRQPSVHIMAPLGKLRAIDANWTSGKLQSWRSAIERALNEKRAASEHVRVLAHLGCCIDGEPGLFYAENASQFELELAEIKRVYISALGESGDAPKRERRTRLSSELRQRFKKLNVLGKSIDDL